MRVSFIVDGFNLYHSLLDAEKAVGTCVKWLDLRNLCASFLSAIGDGAQLAEVYYFSAFAYYRDKVDPGTTSRHRAFAACLHDSGV